MPQQLTILSNDTERLVSLPSPDADVIPGVKWGRFDHVFTPAYWYVRAEFERQRGRFRFHAFGSDLTQEVIACLLGGFGMPAEMGMAAFRKLVAEGLLEDPNPAEARIRESLSGPLQVRSRVMKYRYPNQKARYICSAMEKLKAEHPPQCCALSFRRWLLSFEGIGLKTASWITRNHRDSDDVAILDVHVMRAGVLAGVFDPTQTVAREYLSLEKRFVDFAKGLGVRLSELDALIWDEMRQIGWLARRALAPQLDLNFCHSLSE